MSSLGRLWRRLLRFRLADKILLANSAIVAVGAVSGTVITVWHVRRFPDQPHLELIAGFLFAGIAISFVVNRWVLRLALTPLDRLQQAVDAIRRGESHVAVDPGPTSDERFDRLVDTFNRMLVQLEASQSSLRQLPRQIIQAQEDERHRLARDLHDEAAQALTSLLVRLRLLERAQDPAEAQARVQELRELTAQALEEVRRVALDLRPTILDDLGLGPALEWRVDELNRGGGLHATLWATGLDRRLPREVELTFYRVAQESLSNAARHAQAQSVNVELTAGDGRLRLAITDDGCGFDPDAVAVNDRRGLGLVGMHERLAMVDGQLEVFSAPGCGTRIVASAPLEFRSRPPQ